jgi:hypothetical protein
VEAKLAMQKSDFTPTEIKLDELWVYVGKKKLPMLWKLKQAWVKNGSGRP